MDLWLGPAKKIDFNPAYLPFNWRGWWLAAYVPDEGKEDAESNDQACSRRSLRTMGERLYRRLW